MDKHLSISVVGGGIGGLAVATALAQSGMQVTVLEQAAQIAEVGAGLQVSPNGLRVLRALGLEERLSQHSSQGQAVSLRRAESDYEVARLDLNRLLNDQRYHFVHRADLIDLLYMAALEADVIVKLAQSVVAIEPGVPATVRFANGTSNRSDLVIDAGGLHSVLRGALNKKTESFFTGQVAWRALVSNVDNRQHDVQVHMAPRSHIVSYPLRGGEMVNLVAVQERSEWSDEGWSHRDDPDNLRAVFNGAAPSVRKMLERVEDVNLWGLFRHPVADHWYGQGCVLLGDAAHPTLPFLAQGANMALEDAWALCACLLRTPDLNSALLHYETIRKPRVRKVIEAANNNAWRYHLPRGPVRLAAHMALGLGSRIAPSVMLKQFDWLYGYDITSAFDQN